MTIILTLRDMAKMGLLEEMGFDSYCIAEGADPDTQIEMEYTGDIDTSKLKRKGR